MPDQKDGARARALALAEKAVSRPEDPTAPGKFMASTIATLAVCVGGGLVALVVVLLMEPEAPYRFLVGLGAVVLGLGALAGLLKFVGEAIQTSPRDRTTPEKALKAFLYSLEQLRWPAASACLSWAAKDGDEIGRPAMPDIDLEEARFTISGQGDLATYWNDFVGRFKSRGSRRLRYKVRSAKELSDTVALVPVEVGITLDMNTAALGGEARKRRGFMSGFNSVRVNCRWPVYKREGLWYLLAAGLPEDMKVARD
ncbi:MAG: hypothetical protein ACYS9X_24245 [Planctomycetota bacterium]|jgi:hypothetical protein